MSKDISHDELDCVHVEAHVLYVPRPSIIMTSSCNVSQFIGHGSPYGQVSCVEAAGHCAMV